MPIALTLIKRKDVRCRRKWQQQKKNNNQQRYTKEREKKFTRHTLKIHFFEKVGMKGKEESHVKHNTK